MISLNSGHPASGSGLLLLGRPQVQQMMKGQTEHTVPILASRTAFLNVSFLFSVPYCLQAVGHSVMNEMLIFDFLTL